MLLSSHGVGDGPVESGHDGTLGGSQRQRRLGGELGRPFQGGGTQRFGFDDGGDQTDAEGRLGVDRIPGQEQRQRVTAADDAGQALCPAPPGDDAEVDLGLTEAGGTRCEANVARERDLAAAAEGDAVDGGNHGQARGFDGERQVLAARDGGTTLGDELGDVGTGREELGAVAGNDHGAAIGVSLGTGEGLAEPGDNGLAHGIHGRVDDRQDSDGAFALDANGIVEKRGHRNLLMNGTEGPAKRGHGSTANAPRRAEPIAAWGIMTPMATTPKPLPDLPRRYEPERLRDLSDAELTDIVAAARDVERTTIVAMAPYDRQIKELRSRLAEVATERRRRERAAHMASRKAVRESAASGDMPSFSDALASAESPIPEGQLLAELPVFLRTGGEVRLGFPGRPGPTAFTDGRQTRNATTWGEARQLFRDGWEPGTPQVMGVRVHLVGTRVERVASTDDVVVSGA